MTQDENTPRKQSLFTVFRSVSASMFGVQSSKQHKEDFAQGNIAAYIIVGLIATLLFILGIWGLVRLAVSATSGV